MTEEEELTIKMKYPEMIEQLPCHWEEGEIIYFNLVASCDLAAYTMEEKSFAVIYGRDIYIPVATDDGEYIANYAITTLRNFRKGEHTLIVFLSFDDSEDLEAGFSHIPKKITNLYDLAEYYASTNISDRSGLRAVEEYLVTDGDKPLILETDCPYAVDAMMEAFMEIDGEVYKTIISEAVEATTGTDPEERKERYRRNLIRFWVKYVASPDNDHRLY